MHMIFTLHLMSQTTSEKENDIVRYGDKGAEKLKYHWFSRLSLVVFLLGFVTGRFSRL